MKFLRNEDIAYFWKCLSNIFNNWESRKYFRVCMSSYFSLSLEHFINYFPTMKYLTSLFNFYYYFCSRAVPLFFLLLLLPFIPIWVMSIESWMWKERGGVVISCETTALFISLSNMNFYDFIFFIFLQWILFIILNIYGINALYSNWIRNHSPSTAAVSINSMKGENVIPYFENTKKYNKISV